MMRFTSHNTCPEEPNTYCSENSNTTCLREDELVSSDIHCGRRLQLDKKRSSWEGPPVVDAPQESKEWLLQMEAQGLAIVTLKSHPEEFCSRMVPSRFVLEDDANSGWLHVTRISPYPFRSQASVSTSCTDGPNNKLVSHMHPREQIDIVENHCLTSTIHRCRASEMVELGLGRGVERLCTRGSSESKNTRKLDMFGSFDD